MSLRIPDFSRLQKTNPIYLAFQGRISFDVPEDVFETTDSVETVSAGFGVQETIEDGLLEV